MAPLLKLANVFLAIYMVSWPIAGQTTVTCGKVKDAMDPCIPYVTSSGGPTSPPPSCCSGLKSVKAMAQTTDERGAVCQCVKEAAANTKGLNYELAAKLPSQCGVPMSYTFGPNTNCSKVK